MKAGVFSGSSLADADELLTRVRGQGAMLGAEQPIVLQLLEIPPAMEALEGVVMELDDCAFPLLHAVEISDDPDVAFRDTDIGLLVGSRPRGPGMERKELLEANAAIFSVQGKALNDGASRNVKVLVVGNPANTNCLIAQRNAPDLDPKSFTAMTRLDHNRAIAQLASRTGHLVGEIKGVSIWGNHSATMYPDLLSATVQESSVMDLVDMDWYKNVFIPTIQQRGASIIEARGASSAAGSFTIGGSPKTGTLEVTVPGSGSDYVIPCRPETPGATVPRAEVGKQVAEELHVWWDLGRALTKRGKRYNNSRLLEEIESAELVVNTGGGSAVTSMVDNDENRIVHPHYIRTTVKAGTTATNYLLTLTVTGSSPPKEP